MRQYNKRKVKPTVSEFNSHKSHNERNLKQHKTVFLSLSTTPLDSSRTWELEMFTLLTDAKKFADHQWQVGSTKAWLHVLRRRLTGIKIILIYSTRDPVGYNYPGQQSVCTPILVGLLRMCQYDKQVWGENKEMHCILL